MNKNINYRRIRIMMTNQIKTPRNPRFNYIVLAITVFSGFLIFGFSENVKGPAVPRMQADFSLSELQVGLMLALNSLAYLIACFYTAAVARKIGLKAALIICLVGMAVSGAGICFSPNYAALVASYFVMYLGNGMLEITLGVMAATIFTKNTGTMMNLAHFFYGASSIFAPLLSTGLMKARFGSQMLGWRYMYLIVLAWSIIPVIPALMGKLVRNTENTTVVGYKAFLKNPSSWLIMLILSFGVTCETGIGGWLANFVEKAYGYNESSAAFVLTAFFICFTLARLLLGPIIDKIGFVRSLLIFTAFSGIMIVAGVLFGKSGIPLLAAAGIGIAPIYPTVMALLAKLFADNIDSAMTVTLTVMGIVIVLGNLALGGIVNLLRGIFTYYKGESGIGTAYASGYMFLGVCCIAACLVTLALYKQLKRAGKMI